MKAKPFCKPGSVTARSACAPSAMTVIPLGPPLPAGSSRLPADSASSVVVRLFGVAPDGGCRVSPASREGGDSSLWPCSSPSLQRRRSLLRPGVTRHPALWSPDFPLPRRSEAATIRKASRDDYRFPRPDEVSPGKSWHLLSARRLLCPRPESQAPAIDGIAVPSLESLRARLAHRRGLVVSAYESFCL